MAKARKKISLALQGGGAHGAFTWGVLDRLLEDERLEIEAISGASAGAMNAVVLAAGYAKGKTEGAREALRDFWTKLSDATSLSPLARTPWEALIGGWNLFDHSPFFAWFDMLSRVASPYDMNPLNWNPVRDLLKAQVDFDHLREHGAIQLFVTATNVETGRARVFRRAEIGADHVMASACLPMIFQAVEIDGVPYWDGGYMGNPSLWPLFQACETSDIVIVQLNPVERPGAPRSARDILNRLNEITFNASLLREFRAIDFVSRLIKNGRLEGTGYKDMRIHILADPEVMAPLGEASKLTTDWSFLSMLFEKGRANAEAWLAAHYADLGKRSTVDLRAMFQGDEEGFGDALRPAGR